MSWNHLRIVKTAAESCQAATQFRAAGLLQECAGCLTRHITTCQEHRASRSIQWLHEASPHATAFHGMPRHATAEADAWVKSGQMKDLKQLFDIQDATRVQQSADELLCLSCQWINSELCSSWSSKFSFQFWFVCSVFIPFYLFSYLFHSFPLKMVPWCFDDSPSVQLRFARSFSTTRLVPAARLLAAAGVI